MKTIGVGVIGASALNPGWAVAAHLPAIQALDGFELKAVSTSSRASAEASASAFGVPAFDDHRPLIERSDVDLVVTVKVPHHHALISAALEAGKMVFSEWPLGAGLAEAVDLAARAQAAGVRTVAGLQARFAPAIRRAAELVAEGYVGEVLGTTVVGSGLAWGPTTDRAHAYMFDKANGATTLSVPAMHAIDALAGVLGELEDVTARLAVRRRFVAVAEDQMRLPVSAPDQIAIAGRLAGGAVASVFYRGGLSRGDNLRWEINGSDGDLVLSADHGNIQVADVRLSGGRGDDQRVREIPVAAADTFQGPGANVARLYAQFARDLREGTRIAPDFDHAVRRHRLLADIERGGGG
jgi:predicted dehydrogenase